MGENRFVPRVTQLDATTLDKEISQILKAQLVNVFQISNPNLLAKWEPELDALLSVLLWKFSVLNSNATFGQQLLGIKYSIHRRKAYGLAIILIGGKYLADRSRTIVSAVRDQQFSSVISAILRWSRVSTQAFSLINTALFLVEGRFPSLADRLLGLQPIPASSKLSRNVGYSYMTRELLWHGFIELLVFILPLVNYRALQSQLRSLLGTQSLNSPRETTPRISHNSTCVLCSQPPVLPHHIGCGHVFCAYCLNANLLADPKLLCPMCGIQAMNNAKHV